MVGFVFFFRKKIERVERSKMFYIYHRGVKRSGRRSENINQTESCETGAVLLCASKLIVGSFSNSLAFFCKSLQKLMRTSIRTVKKTHVNQKINSTALHTSQNILVWYFCHKDKQVKLKAMV